MSKKDQSTEETTCCGNSNLDAMEGKQYLVNMTNYSVSPQGTEYVAFWGTFDHVHVEGEGVSATRTLVFTGKSGSRFLVDPSTIKNMLECEEPRQIKSRSWDVHEGQVRELQVPCKILVLE